MVVFGPIIKKALDELRAYEDETSLKTGNILVVSSSQQPQQPTLVNSVISQQLQQTNLFLIISSLSTVYYLMILE